MDANRIAAKITGSINLLIIIVIIVLLFVAKNRYDDHFVNVAGEIGPLGSAMLQGQPLLYQQQLYPRDPYVPRLGLRCVGGDCGPSGTCTNGVCMRNNYDTTAMGVGV